MANNTYGPDVGGQPPPAGTYGAGREPLYPQTIFTPPERVEPVLRRISWSAVFAGVVVALVTQMALALLGLAIGFGTVDPATEQQPMAGLGLGAAIWFLVSTIIALFLGGWVAGHLAGIPKRSEGLLHGVVTWGLVTLVSFYLMTTVIGRLVNAAGGVIGQVMQTGGELAPQVRQELRERGVTIDQPTPAERRQATQQLEQQAQQVGQDVAEALSAAALSTFIAMVLGAAAAAAGGLLGAPKEIISVGVGGGRGAAVHTQRVD